MPVDGSMRLKTIICAVIDKMCIRFHLSSERVKSSQDAGSLPSKLAQNRHFGQAKSLISKDRLSLLEAAFHMLSKLTAQKNFNLDNSDAGYIHYRFRLCP